MFGGLVFGPSYTFFAELHHYGFISRSIEEVDAENASLETRMGAVHPVMPRAFPDGDPWI